MGECDWFGISGSSYRFTVFEMYGTWNDYPGLYLFAGIQNGRWKPFYIGETQSFKERMPMHERWTDAILRGATHVHAFVYRGEEWNRRKLEMDLIQNYRPELNQGILDSFHYSSALVGLGIRRG